MTRFLSTIALLVCFGGPLVARAQLVNGEFPDELLVEDFDNNSHQWEQNSTATKFYIISGGKYVVHRLSSSDPDLIPAPTPVLARFQITFELSFDNNKNNEQSAGLVFMTDAASHGMYVLELNEKKQFRVYRRNDSGNVYLTGVAGKPWEKSNYLKGGHAINFIELRGDSQNYDIYFNGGYGFGFRDENLAEGRVGLFVAADSKALFHHLYINSRKDKPLATKPAPPQPSGQTQTPTPAGHSQPAATVEQQLQQLKLEVEELRKKLDDCCNKKP